MIPQGVDMPNLTEQLRADGVAFTNPKLAGDAGVNASVGDALRPGEGIAVVDVHLAKAADARDIAQELKDATGLETVIVQTPGKVSAVSDVYSRAEIESAQQSIPAGTDQVALLAEFHAGVEATHFPWGVVLGVLIVAAVGALAAFRSARDASRERFQGDTGNHAY